ncbi:hypothetical protein FHR38_002616 [Micromonospora polyrhachis]|uniref:Uncharacterized protein n=1 Tax=Micromonospora polyrhachis TaxID=1282883 RepID=A0A7W7SQ42_9ACTN|nr:hypothetical protein [Micromonospora polyrhachis]
MNGGDHGGSGTDGLEQLHPATLRHPQPPPRTVYSYSPAGPSRTGQGQDAESVSKPPAR